MQYPLPADQARIWLISNATSGSHDAEAVDDILARFAAAGHPVDQCFVVGEDDLPTADAASAAGTGLVVIHGGDGTITSAAQSLTGWDGEILALPGGTMNLLAHALHGDLSSQEIVAAALAERTQALHVPVITGEGHCALAGIIAGPTSAWGDVREHVRSRDIRALASSVGAALDKTLGGDDIRIAGQTEGYQAVYLQPGRDGMSVRGVLARNAAELLLHGWAWLSGDFREGPSVELGQVRDITLAGNGPVGLLVDGERAQGGATLHFRLGESAHRYLSCLGEVRWS